MAKATKKVVRVVAGLLPSLGAYHHITVYADDSIRIERPFCHIDPRREYATLEESSWKNHQHLIGMIEPSAYLNESHT